MDVGENQPPLAAQSIRLVAGLGHLELGMEAGDPAGDVLDLVVAHVPQDGALGVEEIFDRL